MSQDRRIVRVVVLTVPTVAFPFPGEPEINFIARVHDDHIPPKDCPEGYDSTDEKWWHANRIVTVVIDCADSSLPEIGSEVQVREYENFYRGRGHLRLPRLCLL